MIKYATALVLSCALAAPAAAQDWTGPYVGVHLGYGTGSSDAEGALSGQWDIESQALRDEVTDFISHDLDPKGAVYGVQAGYDFQANNNLVFGVEADFSLLGVDDDRSTPLTPTATSPSLSYAASNGVDAKHMFSLRGKAGVALGSSSLVYVDAGWAWVKAEYDAALSSNGGYMKAGSRTKTSNGFVIGGGFEHRLAANVSARLDYSYTDQGGVRFANDYLPGSTFASPVYTETYEQDLKLHLIRVALNYRF
jgi:opacity protein-like surface antigen